LGDRVLDLAGACDDITAALLNAGVRAVVDERDINPPCVYVPPPVITDRSMGGRWSAEWQTWAVVGDTGRASSLANLSELVAQVDAALALTFVRGEPADLITPDSGRPLPGYRLYWTQRLTEGT
jgi:hypothetical protein